MKRDRLSLGFAIVLTVLYAGAMAAALTGRAEQWSVALRPEGLHILGGFLVVAIVLNLARGEGVKP